jgi:hypothetical protein
MVTVTKIEMRGWELATLAAASAVFTLMSWALITDFSARRLLWPRIGEGRMARPIGRVSYLLNTVLRQAQGQPEFTALKPSDPVYPFDTLMAGPGSALKITLGDNSVVEIGENSMIRLAFDSSLQLNGVTRETVVEVVSGTVGAQGGEHSGLKILSLSNNRTYTATREESVELSSKGKSLLATKVKEMTVVQKTAEHSPPVVVTAPPTAEELARRAAELAAAEAARRAAELAQARKEFAKLGGVMTGGPNAPVSLSDVAASIKKSNPSRVAGGGKLGTHGLTAAEAQKKVAMNTHVVDELLKPALTTQTRSEVARATQIEPADNFSVKTGSKGAPGFEFPVRLKWNAAPDNAAFKVRFALKASGSAPAFEEVVKVTAREGEVAFKHVLKRPGDYSWKIEDEGGATLSVRSIHVDSRFQAIELAEPMLIGREQGTKMWEAQTKWGFLFKWTPVPTVTEYKVRITRNAKMLSGDSAPLAEKVTHEPEFVLPFRKEWQAEKMFFSVEAVHPKGFQLASNSVPFIFTFLPPRPRLPVNKKSLNRAKLNDGGVEFRWEAMSEADKFTIEIGTDPKLKKKLETQLVDENSFRWYPPGPGKYYWRVRGDKDSISSPYSETFEFDLM